MHEITGPLHVCAGATSVLGVSATQMCARNASGSAVSLVPGARRRPGAGRLMSAAFAAVPALAALRTAFLDLQLATEASRGADWATLTSTGVPLPDPLDISAMSAQCVSLVHTVATYKLLYRRPVGLTFVVLVQARHTCSSSRSQQCGC